MNKEQIKITLPEYIDNIFNHNSWEIDYLKNTFDDREINQEAFYELNFQIYKSLLKQNNFNNFSDEDKSIFLEVKRNLYYLEESWFENIKLTFKLSDEYSENNKNFLNNEINKIWTKFDKNYSNFFKKSFDKTFSSERIKEIWNNVDNYGIYYIFSKLASNDKWITLFKEIFSKNEILKYIKNNFYWINLFIEWFSSIENLISFYEYLKIDIISLIDKKKLIGENWIVIHWIVEIINLICWTSKGAIFLDKIFTKKDIKEKITDKNDFLISIVEKLSQTDEWIKYLWELNIKNNILILFEEWNVSIIFLINNLFLSKKGIVFLESIFLKKDFNSMFWRNIHHINNIFYIKEWLEFIENNVIIENNNDIEKLVKFNLIKYFWFQFLLNKKIDFTKLNIKKVRIEKQKTDEKVKKEIEELLKEWKIKEEIKKENKWVINFIGDLWKTKEWIEYFKTLEISWEIKELLEKDNIWILQFIRNLWNTKDWIDYLTELDILKDLKRLFLKWENWIILLLRELLNAKEWIEFFKTLNFSNNEIKKSLNQYSKIYISNLWNSKEWIEFLKKISIKSEVKKLLFKWNSEINNLLKNLWENPNLPEWQKYLKQILKTETNNLKNQISEFITTSNSGSCLLSWYRGTWKTSLITSAIKMAKEKKENEDIVKVMINIPEQKKDENWETKSFSKNDLINKIIREIYLSLKKEWYWKKEIADFEEQYIRTFNNVENIEKDVKKTELALNFIIDNLLLSIFTTGLILYWIPISLAIKSTLFWGIIFILGLFVFKINYSKKHEKSTSKIIKELYTDDIAENKLNENIKDFTKNKKRKLVIVIDELDKLLDLDKKNDGSNVSMKDIFDLLWKLKTLFFDNQWAVFFVVTNKDAYDYYLENRYSEDDLISNIFNKVLYLPMTKKENFNLNRTFEIEWIEKNKSEYMNQWLYYKSHWNWRKANFILNQRISWKEIIIDKKEVEYDKKFYKFMDILYDMFFDETGKKFLEYTKKDEKFYYFVENYLNKKNSLSTEVFNPLSYSVIINKLLIWIDRIKLLNEESKKITLTNIKSLGEKYSSAESFETFAYIFSSVDKISGQPAYRDYIINNILNILEILKHDRSLRLKDIFYRLKFWEIDVKYPIFEDFVLIWIPFMIFYFDNEKENEE